MPTPSIVPKILPLLEAYLEKVDELWSKQDTHPRTPTLPLCVDGKVNVTAITAALGLKESQVQHFHKHKELSDAVNTLCKVQGIKPIGSRVNDETEYERIAEDRAKLASKQLNDSLREAAEREALVLALRQENERLREQLRMLEQCGMILRQQVIQ